MASPEPPVADSPSEPVGIGTIGMMVLLSVVVASPLELLEATEEGFSVGKEVVSSAAVAGTLGVEEASVIEAPVETPVPVELSETTVERTGTAVVPSVPVEVLKLYTGEEVSASDTGTGITVGPDEPVMVLEVTDGLEDV